MTHDYTLYYWPIPFRGHFIRYVLAQAGASWAEAGFDEVAALKALAVAEQPVPFMGPPVLHDHGADIWLTQMPAIMLYLGRKHGLVGDEVLATRLIADAVDILLEITRCHGMQMWRASDWEPFLTGRLVRWMQIHERVMPGHVQGDPVTLEHLVLGALWHTMADRLPVIRAHLHAHAPALEALADSIAALPRIHAMLAQWQESAARYCGGRIEASLLAMLERSPGPGSIQT